MGRWTTYTNNAKEGRLAGVLEADHGNVHLCRPLVHIGSVSLVRIEEAVDQIKEVDTLERIGGE